eukprot:3650227-Prymnesium_polylepis.1
MPTFSLVAPPASFIRPRVGCNEDFAILWPAVGQHHVARYLAREYATAVALLETLPSDSLDSEVIDLSFLVKTKPDGTGLIGPALRQHLDKKVHLALTSLFGFDHFDDDETSLF